MFMRKLLKKVVAGVIAASVMAVSVFASPADAYAASAGRVPSGIISKIGKETINIYAWDNSMKPQVDMFKKKYPKYAKRINYVNLNASGEYADEVNNAVQAGGKFAPDIIFWDSNDLGYAMSKSYTVPLSKIGFDARWYNDAYNYTKVLGKKNGKLTAVTASVCPGAYAYKRTAAKKAFGTDYSVTVQTKMKDWSTFLSSAKTANKKDVKILSSISDPIPAVLYSSTTAFAKNGVKQFPSNISTMYNVSKYLKTGDYTKNRTRWSYDWEKDMSNPEVLGYFVAPWMLQNMKTKGVNLKNYALIEGPADYYWGGTFMTATNKCHNKGLAQLFLYTLTCDKDFQYKYAVSSVTVPNNKTATAKIINAKIGARKFGTANDPYKVFDKVARKIKGRPIIEDDWVVVYSVTNGVEKLAKGRISTYKEFRLAIKDGF